MAGFRDKKDRVNEPAPLRPGSIVIVCEGKRDKAVLTGLLKANPEAAQFDVRVAGSVQTIKNTLELLVKDPGFTCLSGLAIIRDADDAAPQSLLDWFNDKWKTAGLPAPDSIGVWRKEEDQTIATLSLVAGQGEPPVGNLEHLILESLEGDPRLDCVAKMFECAQIPAPAEKTRLKAWLSLQLDAYIALCRPKDDMAFSTAAESGPESGLLPAAFWERLLPIRDVLLTVPGLPRNG